MTIQLNPQNVKAYSVRGIARLEAGYLPVALVDLQKAAALYRAEDNQVTHQNILNIIQSLQAGK